MALRLLLHVLLLVAWLPPGAAQASRYLVVDVTGAVPPAPAVSSILGGTRLELPAGVSVTLLAESGRLLRIAGPFTGLVEEVQGNAPPASPLRAFFDRLVPLRGVGGLLDVRGPPTASTPGDAATIDLRLGGTQCLLAGAPPQLAGLNPRSNLRVFLRRAGGAQTYFDWPAGAATVPWPSDVPLVDGANYNAGLGTGAGAASGAAPRTFGLRILTTSAEGLPLVLLLAEHGCDAQAEALARRLAQDLRPAQPVGR